MSTLRTNCLLDFVHRPDKILNYNIKSRRFGSWFFFRLQVMGEETPTQMTYSDGSIWVGVSPPNTWKRKKNPLPKSRDFILYVNILSGQWTKSRRQLVHRQNLLAHIYIVTQMHISQYYTPSSEPLAHSYIVTEMHISLFYRVSTRLFRAFETIEFL